MRDYVSFFKDASAKDKATFVDGFLAAMIVYDIRCPEEDDPDSHATQSWVIGEIYKAQMAYKLQQREFAKLIFAICGPEKSALREAIFSAEPVDSNGLERYYCSSKGYTVDKYEVMAMLMDCAYVDCYGNEVDAEGNPVSAENHKPWPQVAYHHNGNGSELSFVDYNKLPEDSKKQYKPVRYVEVTVAMGAHKERICEDSYRFPDLIDGLLAVGDPINERLYRHNNLVKMLLERFGYNLPGQIRAFEEKKGQACYTEHSEVPSGCVAIISGQTTI